MPKESKIKRPARDKKKKLPEINPHRYTRLNNNAMIPSPSFEGQHGYDFLCHVRFVMKAGRCETIHTGVKICFAQGEHGYFYPGIRFTLEGLTVMLSGIFGLYEKEIQVHINLSNHTEHDIVIEPGDSVARFVFVKCTETPLIKTD
jgi:dUTPase